MRAVLVGLVGAVLVVGGAGACDLDNATLVDAVYGTHYHVNKVKSHFWRLESPVVNDRKPDGYVLVLVEGGGKKLILTQNYSAYGSPNNSGVAISATPESLKLLDGNERATEAEKLRVDGSFNLQDGPLGDTRLTARDCK